MPIDSVLLLLGCIMLFITTMLLGTVTIFVVNIFEKYGMSQKDAILALLLAVYVVAAIMFAGTDMIENIAIRALGDMMLGFKTVIIVWFSLEIVGAVIGVLLGALVRHLFPARS